MFQAKSAEVLNLQNKVEEVSVKLGDQIVSVSGSVATVDVGETIVSISSVLFVDDSAGTCAPVAAASRVVSGTTVALTLSAALAANDAIIVRYVTTH